MAIDWNDINKQICNANFSNEMKPSYRLDDLILPGTLLIGSLLIFFIIGIAGMYLLLSLRRKKGFKTEETYQPPNLIQLQTQRTMNSCEFQDNLAEFQDKIYMNDNEGIIETNLTSIERTPRNERPIEPRPSNSKSSLFNSEKFLQGGGILKPKLG